MSPKHDDIEPRIYVADLAAYNQGLAGAGAWIDAAQDPDEIRAEIEAMLEASPVPGAEEWAIHSTEGFGEIEIGESEDIDKVAEIAALIKEHGELFAALVSHMGGLRYLDEAVEAMQENYRGEYDSLADWAEKFAEETGAPPETYMAYVDWSRVGRDAELGGDVFTVELDGKTHVFSN
jgi:antirestriction protein